MVLSAASGPITEIADNVKKAHNSIHKTGGVRKGILRPAIIA